MATIVKDGARKVKICGQPKVGYENYARPGHLVNKHYSVKVGDHKLRLEPEEAERVVKELASFINQYGS